MAGAIAAVPGGLGVNRLVRRAPAAGDAAASRARIPAKERTAMAFARIPAAVEPPVLVPSA